MPGSNLLGNCTASNLNVFESRLLATGVSLSMSANSTGSDTVSGGTKGGTTTLTAAHSVSRLQPVITLSVTPDVSVANVSALTNSQFFLWERNCCNDCPASTFSTHFNAIAIGPTFVDGYAPVAGDLLIGSGSWNWHDDSISQNESGTLSVYLRRWDGTWSSGFPIKQISFAFAIVVSRDGSSFPSTWIQPAWPTSTLGSFFDMTDCMDASGTWQDDYNTSTGTVSAPSHNSTIHYTIS